MLGQPLAALIGHEWRIHAAYASPGSMSSRPRPGAVERLAGLVRPAAGAMAPAPAAGEPGHADRAVRRVLRRQPPRVRHRPGDSGDLTAMAMHFAHGVRLAVLRG